MIAFIVLLSGRQFPVKPVGLSGLNSGFFEPTTLNRGVGAIMRKLILRLLN